MTSQIFNDRIMSVNGDARYDFKNRAKHARIDACGEIRRPQNTEAVSLKQEADSEVVYA